MSRLVALTQRVAVDGKTGERRDALDQRWSDFLALCGLVPLPVPNRPEAALAAAVQAPLAGLILSGGNDLAALGGDAPERDETERALVDWARGRGLPIFGVCRGAQHLAHLLGGKVEKLPGHAGTRHLVAPGGREVNSYHGFAILAAPPEAEVTARAPDGSIEAFRLPALCIEAMMWHPEREAAPHPEDVELFRKAMA